MAARNYVLSQGRIIASGTGAARAAGRRDAAGGVPRALGGATHYPLYHHLLSLTSASHGRIGVRSPN
jgi:hypothetical protein